MNNRFTARIPVITQPIQLIKKFLFPFLFKDSGLIIMYRKRAPTAATVGRSGGRCGYSTPPTE
jgi:hypothetical protein